jgi:hypothetical protein
MYQVPRHIDGAGIGRYLSDYRTTNQITWEVVGCSDL